MSAIPLLLGAMVELWSESLPDWTVTYGWDDTNNTGDYLMVGADDPFASEGEAAVSSQTFETATREGMSESGYVTVVAFSWVGSHDGQREATEAVFAAMQRIETDIHTAPDLGITRTPHFMVNALTIEDAKLHHGLDDDGARALLVIRIHFEAYRRVDLS
jgi:hypothetical protein